MSRTFVTTQRKRDSKNRHTYQNLGHHNLLYLNTKKSIDHIYAYTPKGLVKLQLGLLAIVNKAQFDPINARCGTQQTDTLIRIWGITTALKNLKTNNYLFPSNKLTTILHR